MSNSNSTLAENNYVPMQFWYDPDPSLSIGLPIRVSLTHDEDSEDELFSTEELEDVKNDNWAAVEAKMETGLYSAEILLSTAVRYGAVNVTEGLLEREVYPHSSLDYNLVMNSRNKNTSMALVQHGANPFAVVSFGYDITHTVFDNPVVQRDADYIRMYLDLGVKPQPMTLYSVAKYSTPEILELLIDGGGDINGYFPNVGKRWKYRYTLLTYAAEHADTGTLIRLLRAGTDPNKPDESGVVAMDYAVKKKYKGIIRALNGGFGVNGL